MSAKGLKTNAANGYPDLKKGRETNAANGHQEMRRDPREDA